MKMTLEEVRKSIDSGEIAVLSLDTSVFDAKQLGLEWGILKRVAQFKGGEVAFVLSEIVTKELASHIQRAAVEAEGGLKKALASLGNAWAIPKTTREDVLATCLGGQTPAKVAEQRLNNYVTATGAEILAAEDFVAMPELVKRYFEHLPPFEEKETKKYEFPDAMALLSLDGWAAQEDCRVLVVTHDKGWTSYCDASERLVACDDLAAALGAFQKQEASYHCAQIAASVHDGDPLDLREEVAYAVRERARQAEIHVDAASQFYYQEDAWDVEVKAIEFAADGHGVPVFETVEYDGSRLVTQVHVTIRAEVAVEFSFQKWDGIDREYMPMGSGQVTTDEMIETDVLVTFRGPFPDKVSIDEIEVDPLHIHLELGELEPDWMSDPEGFE
jgi:PIN domain